VSLGCAESFANETAEDFFERIDALLYAAKHQGRNRVVADARGASEQWIAEESGRIVQIVWREAYASGNPQIDAEHRELFALANEVIAASLRPSGESAAFHAALDGCLAHVAWHFAHEEEILAKLRYPKLAEHARLHGELLERATGLKASALRGEAVTGALVEFLAHEVVARHMLTADREFFPLFAAPPGA